ncbi:5-hydroxytryptamine receptor 1A-alpha [Exaiptasia diaphana]|uniref:G-protein coupled receptors family 1 profile domain-containing protein n=1 Tax=Exaiptasia diaphana TaxID=2652724 RepID=A0A913Y1M5_EXADI|nr:5-hydroxytryptamine receptor 1A-alpha [Exaiptasia diaphana]
MAKNMYRYPTMEEMSPACRRQFQECNASSNSSVLLFPKPQGCWIDWAEACSIIDPNLLALITIIIIIAVFSFIGNTIVCVVFCLYEQLRLVKHYFVINLAIVDDILVLVSVPMFAAHIYGGEQNLNLCRTQILLDVFCGTASIISLAVISIERYFAVVVPLHYEQRVTPYRAVLIIIFTWFYSAMVSLILLVSYAVPSSPANTSKACLFFGGEFVILVTVASFILPVCIMAWAYWNIFLVAHAHARQIQAMVPSNQQLPQNNTEGGDTRPQVKMRGELKAAKTLTSIMATHIYCWCPLFVYFLVISFCPQCRSDPASKISNYIIMVLRYCNTLANPIIYTGINRQFRGAIKKFVLRKRGNEELNATVYTQPT